MNRVKSRRGAREQALEQAHLRQVERRPRAAGLPRRPVGRLAQGCWPAGPTAGRAAGAACPTAAGLLAPGVLRRLAEGLRGLLTPGLLRLLRRLAVGLAGRRLLGRLLAGPRRPVTAGGGCGG